MKRSIVVLSIIVLTATSAFAETRVGRRQERQQARIAQGVRSGALTPMETARLERQEARLQAEKADMRQDNGGTLTGADKVKLNRQQNRLSREIYRQKHDAQSVH